jgi:hypothetical protein
MKYRPELTMPKASAEDSNVDDQEPEPSPVFYWDLQKDGSYIDFKYADGTILSLFRPSDD